MHLRPMCLRQFFVIFLTQNAFQKIKVCFSRRGLTKMISVNRAERSAYLVSLVMLFFPSI